MSEAGRAHNAILARGLTGPVEALDAVYLEVVMEVLRECWKALSITHPARLSHEEEPQVSMYVEAWLKKEGAELLETVEIVNVTRGSEATSGDGGHDELRPDLNLHFAMTRAAGLFPLNVECKILDTATNRSITKYGNAGIARFVSGAYGWGRREALMLAYVRDASILPDTLAKYLANPKTAQKLAVRVSPVMVGENARTRHDRPILEIDARPWPMGPIDLWHVWLHLPSPIPTT